MSFQTSFNMAVLGTQSDEHRLGPIELEWERVWQAVKRGHQHALYVHR